MASAHTDFHKNLLYAWDGRCVVIEVARVSFKRVQEVGVYHLNRSKNPAEGGNAIATFPSFSLSFLIYFQIASPKTSEFHSFSSFHTFSSQ